MEETLPPDVVEQVCQRILEDHPEMEGAEAAVARVSRPAGQAEAAAKVGLPAVELLGKSLYTITLRKEVEAEDGVMLPLVVRVTVDEQGVIVKQREGR